MNNNNRSSFVPLVIAISLVVGILVGSFYANHFSGSRLSIINTSSNKLNDMLQIIDAQYVDKVNMHDLVESALPEILKKLDPHSTYVSASDVEASMENLKGGFSGIGVSFSIIADTVRIINVVRGGPSENVGLKAGDRIVAIDKKPFVGKDVTQAEAMKRMKGPKDSKVSIEVLRRGVARPLSFTIKRGNVPVKSIDAAYMLDNETGYIQINTFGDTTYPELLVALAQLDQAGMKKLVIDLRGNGGGYVQPAIQMAGEFLPKNQLILYTQGRRSPREEFRSDGRGIHQSTPLVVLVDEATASASEIFTAAIQDNDRGTIVGRRTFGKGLVQEPIQFRDGSMLRLTIARYYTPAGRCLQKPYTQGDIEDYEMDIVNRIKHGEMTSRDSIHLKGKKFHTRLGRTVYGGGGIMPDIFVPESEKGVTSYVKEAAMKGLLYEYAYVYADAHRATLSAMGNYADIAKYLKRHDIVESFAAYADSHGLKRRNLLINKSHALLENYLTGYVIDIIMDKSSTVRFMNESDPCIRQALSVMSANKAFPTPPASKQQKPARRK